jgi:hypothetical protein
MDSYYGIWTTKYGLSPETITTIRKKRKRGINSEMI